MTIETTTPGGDPLLKSGPYNGDGVVTVFDYDFQIQREEELRVTVLLSGEGTGSELTLTTDYTVSGVGNDDGGQITLASATLAPSGSKLVIEYDGGFNQSIEWSNQGRVQLSILESAFDKVTMHLRLIKDLADRSVKVDQFEETSPDDILDTLFTARDTAVSSAADAVVTLGKTEDVLAAFEEAYLGAFASDPGTDNEGGALKEGALYYNTVGLEVRSYDGTGWASLATADATLTSIAALGTAADKALYTTGVDTWAEMNVTASGRAVLALEDANERLVPTGAVQYFAMDAPPTGWLRADGALLDRTTYAALFNAIGTTYGTTDASNFQLPDLRGEFVRGHDAGAGRDPGRAFGSKQGDMISQHRHAFAHIKNVSPNGSTSEYDSADTALDAFGSTGVNPDKTSDVLNLSDNDAIDKAGHENRPRNIALLPCIKY